MLFHININKFIIFLQILYEIPHNYVLIIDYIKDLIDHKRLY